MSTAKWRAARRERAIPSADGEQGHSTAEDITKSNVEGEPQVVLIDGRGMIRQCLAQCIRTTCHVHVTEVSSIEEWRRRAATKRASVILLSVGDGLQNERIFQELDLLTQCSGGAPLVILSDDNDVDRILRILNAGVRGYIPTTVSLDIAIAALRLIQAGGTYIPTTSLIEARQVSPPLPADPAPCNLGLFTVRQAAVVEELCKGKANKVIAYDLKMRESTVKVHVRNIMKKLRARNRTEVAILATQGQIAAGGRPPAQRT